MENHFIVRLVKKDDIAADFIVEDSIKAIDLAKFFLDQGYEVDIRVE